MHPAVFGLLEAFPIAIGTDPNAVWYDLKHPLIIPLACSSRQEYSMQALIMNQLTKTLVQTGPDSCREKQYLREEKANLKIKTRTPNKIGCSVREAALHPKILTEIERTKSYFAMGFSLPYYLTLNYRTLIFRGYYTSLVTSVVFRCPGRE